MSKNHNHIPPTQPQQHEKRGLHSQSLDLMRFPLAVVVLTVHVSSITQLSGNTYTAGAEAFSRFVEIFLHNQSVPIYFFIAGYVFFYKMEMNRQQYTRKLHNRVKSLLIPYLIWNTVGILLIAAKALVKGDGEFYPTLSNLLSCYWMYDGSLSGRQTELGIYPIDHLELKVNAHIVRQQLATNQYKTASILGATAQYKTKRAVWKLSLQNLLNTRHYTYTTFSATDRYTYDCHLVGRTLLLSCKLHLVKGNKE